MEEKSLRESSLLRDPSLGQYRGPLFAPAQIGDPNHALRLETRIIFSPPAHKLHKTQRGTLLWLTASSLCKLSNNGTLGEMVTLVVMRHFGDTFTDVFGFINNDSKRGCRQTNQIRETCSVATSFSIQLALAFSGIPLISTYVVTSLHFQTLNNVCDPIFSSLTSRHV